MPKGLQCFEHDPTLGSRKLHALEALSKTPLMVQILLHGGLFEPSLLELVDLD